MERAQGPGFTGHMYTAPVPLKAPPSVFLLGAVTTILKNNNVVKISRKEINEEVDFPQLNFKIFFF